jgi:hypothetical protein
MQNRRGAWSAILAFAFLVLLSIPVNLGARQPALADLLVKAGERASALADTTRVLVCEERYKQTLEKERQSAGSVQSGPREFNSLDQREWIAALTLAATPNSTGLGYPWMEFRDVLSVNGKVQGSGVSRLDPLTNDTTGRAVVQAIKISQSSAAFMFGRLERAIELPRAATLFLHPENQPRFEFKMAGKKKVDGVQAVEIRFEEKRKPTIVRGSGDRDAVTKGSLWIDPLKGNLLMSVFKNADSPEVYDEITVMYRVVPEVGLALPSEMSERIIDEEVATRVLATATFSNWHAVAKK